MFKALLMTVALAASVAAYCPDGWIGNSYSCYWRSSYTATWRSARDACTSMSSGGTSSDLVSVQSLSENQFLVATMHASDSWIGLNDLENDGTFVWTDGSSVSYTHWEAGQPNDLLDQDCVNIIEGSSGDWDDNHCKESKSFICERSQ